ncbi:MAG: tetratricopeptide repeat protein [Planctomycetota bacterium]
MLAAADDGPPVVPRDLAPVLERAQEHLAAGAPQKALDVLAGWGGEAHAVHALLRGHALLAAERAQEAGAAYRTALELDPDLRQAGYGLVRSLAVCEQWPAARAEAGRHIAVDRDPREMVLLYASIAHALDDLPLLRAITTTGLLRFPESTAMRRLRLAALVAGDDRVGARELVRSLLRQDPAQAELWRTWAALAEDDPATERVRLQAAVLAAPEDSRLRARLLGAFLAADQAGAAMRCARALMDLRDAWPAEREHDWVELAVRAAMRDEQWEHARIWLGLVPVAARGRSLHLIAARLALQDERSADALAALEALIADGANDPAVLLWAARLAADTGAEARAEALLRQTMQTEGATAATARLHLARLLHAQGRRDAAIALLRTYVGDHPEDRLAARLLAAIRQAAEPAATSDE